jgi:hypothetical protein
MAAQIMISSVSRDRIPLGDIAILEDTWHKSSTLLERLEGKKGSTQPGGDVSFDSIRSEVARHLSEKYGFDAFDFKTGSDQGPSPERQTLDAAKRAHLVIGIFGYSKGFRPRDNNPLSPTLREWAEALQTPEKFLVFWLKGKAAPEVLGPAWQVLKDIQDYKTGKIFKEYENAADLFQKIDAEVQAYLNLSVRTHHLRIASKSVTEEAQQLQMESYPGRSQLMRDALETVCGGMRNWSNDSLELDGRLVPVKLHTVPDHFSIAESKKFVAYVFDDEARQHIEKDAGRLHIVAVYGNITVQQVRRHLGNYEGARVFTDSWGCYACEPGSGKQCVYLPQCRSTPAMHGALGLANTWLNEHAAEIADQSRFRGEMLDLLQIWGLPPGGAGALPSGVAVPPRKPSGRAAKAPRKTRVAGSG